MKKITSLFIIFLITFLSFANTKTLLANAAPTFTPEKIINGEIVNTEIIPLDELYYLEVITYDTTSPQVSTASTTSTVEGAKTHNLKNIFGSVVASYTLYATFSYNGKTSSCTSAIHNETIYDSTWSFTSATASKSGNKATGSYTAKCPSIGQTVSNTITITCDANGNIS